jgi:hypothetical protein
MNSKKHYKPDAVALLNAKAVTIKAMQDRNADEQAVPAEVLRQETDAKEVALLRHQLTNTPRNVNSFLLNKYSDGTAFAVAEKDKYDNSKERKSAGISFTYHVFYPEDPKSTLDLANNRYVVTDKILDMETGDEYYYHFPIRKVIFVGIPYYQNEYSRELINTDGSTTKIPTQYPGVGNPLFHSLRTLAAQLRVGVPQLPPNVFQCLIENDFMTREGKLNLAVKTGVMVEKYFLKFDSQDRKAHGMRYLEQEFGNVVADVPGLEVPEPVKELAAVVPEVVTPPEVAVPEVVVPKPVTELDDEHVEQVDGKVTVKSSAGKSRKGLERLPLPHVDDSLETVIKKLRARGVTVLHLRGTYASKAVIASAKPIPLCFG